MSTTPAPNTPASRLPMRAPRRTRSGCRSRTRAATRSRSTGASTRRLRRASSAARVIEDISIAELIDFIDWSPFFTTWELAGKFPAILDDKIVGEAARSLYDDAQQDARRKSSRRAGSRPLRLRRLLAGEFSLATTSTCSAMRRAASRSRPCTRCASSSRAARAVPTWRWPISSRRPGRPITSAPSW